MSKKNKLHQIKNDKMASFQKTDRPGDTVDTAVTELHALSIEL